MGPYTLYVTLLYWIYPLDQYLGETGCYLFDYTRLVAFYAIQLQSFFQSIFRYICLFHQNILHEWTPNVSIVNFKFRYSASQLRRDTYLRGKTFLLF